MSSFVYAGNANNGLSNHYTVDTSDSDYDSNDPDKFMPKHFKYMMELRVKLSKKAEYYRAYSSSKNVFDYMENTALVNYIDRWISDIDKGMNAWIAMSENIAKGVISSETEGDLSVVKTELSNWFNTYGKYMSPIPDVIVDALGAPETFAKFLKDQMGLDALYDAYQDFKGQIEDMILDFMIYDVANLSEEDVQEMKEALSAPNLVLGERVLSIMDEDMKNYGTASTANDQEFAPFYNSLIMTKLILIGPDGLKNLIYQATGQNIPTGYEKSSGYSSINKLKVRIKTKKNKTKKVVIKTVTYTYYGTNDDVYFGILLRDGTKKEVLFDRSSYDDFESNCDDTYDFTLPSSIIPSDITKIWLRKQKIGPGDDWNPEFIELTGYYSNTKVFSAVRYNGLPEFNGNETWSQTVSFSTKLYTTSLNTGLIDYMLSLDESLQWQNSNNPLWSNETLRTNVFYKIFKDVEKFDDPTYDMYAPYQSPVSVKVNFDANGGFFTKGKEAGTFIASSTKNVDYNAAYGELPTPQLSYHTFDGWYTDSKEGAKITGTSVLDQKESVTLYAHWTKVEVGAASVKTLKNSSASVIAITLNATKNAAGYEVTYTTDSKMKSGLKKVELTSTTKKITKLKKGKTYYIKVRAYKMDSQGNKVYGSYSKIKKIKIIK